MPEGRTPNPQGRTWPLVALRLALAALGALALFIGLWNAWDSNATTAPLILGAVAVALALALDPNLSEISGRYGSAEFKIVRGRVLNAAELIRTAAGTIIDVQKRTELEEIAGEVERQSLPPPRETGLRSLARRLQRLFWSDTPGPVEAPIASDQVEDEEARAAYFEQFRSGYEWAKDVTDWGLPTPVYFLYMERQGDEPITRRFSASPSWWGDWRLEVHVRDPQGRTSATIIHGASGMQQNTFYLDYPRGFPGASPIDTPGDYVFTWRRVGAERTVLAQDTITVTPEMLDPAALDDVEEQMPGTGYRVRYWKAEAPTEPPPEQAQREAETAMDIERVVFPRDAGQAAPRDGAE